jgi:PAS domain S-box-containing protein
MGLRVPAFILAIFILANQSLWANNTSPLLHLTDAERAWLDTIHLQRPVPKDWMPFDFQDRDGNFIGISEDYWGVLRDMLGLRETVTGLQSVSAIFQDLQQGRADIHISATHVAERASYLVYSDSYAQYPIAIAMRKGVGFISNASVLEGQKVAVGQDYGTYHVLKAHYPGIKFIQVKNTAAALQKVADGAVVAAVDILPALQYQLAQFEGNSVILAGVSKIGFPLQIALRKEYAALIPLINRAIKAIPAEHALRIQKNWMGKQIVVNKHHYSLLWQVIGGALLIIALILYWNRTLVLMQRQLHEQREKYQRLVDDIGPNYVVFSERADGTTEYLSKGFAHVFGVPPQLGKNWQTCVVWDAETLSKTHEIQRQFTAGLLNQAEQEMRFTHPDGSVRTLAATIHAVRDGEGKHIHNQGILQDITERKRAIAELREAVKQREIAERFARGVIDALSAHLCVLDEHGNVLMVNQAWREFAEDNPPVAPNHGLGANYLQMCKGEFAANLQAVLTGEKSGFQFEYPCDSPYAKRWFVAHVTRFEVDGKMRVVVAHENISERKLAENATRQNEARYRSLIEAMAEGMVMHNRNGDIVEWNTAAERILGLNEEQMQEQSLVNQQWEALHEDGAAFSPDQYPTKKALQTGQSQLKVVMGVYRANGQLTWISVNAEPLFAPDEDEAYAVVTTFDDISERKHVQDALDWERRRLRILFDTIPDLIWYKDTEGRYLGCNRRFEQFFGAMEKDILGKTDHDFVSRDLADFFRQHDRNALEAGHALSNEEEICFASDGHKELLETTKAPMYDRHGKVIGVLGIGHDISERKQTEQDLIQAREAAESANRAKSSFLANMSHELRTPLNAVLGFTQILAGAEDLQADYQRMVSTINRSGEYLLTLLNDVLDFSKIEAGRFEINPRACELREVLSGIADIFSARAQQKGLHFKTNLAPDLPLKVEIDDKRLRQILLNLLGNAIKFTETGTVELSCCYENACLFFTVRDSGIGIAQDKLATIFQPFQQIGEERYKMQGTGLGLAICLKLTELMDGQLNADSREGEGSTFSARLPVKVLQTAPDVKSASAEESQRIIGYQRLDGDKPYRILVVDDVRYNRAVLHAMLEPLGFAIDVVDSGETCLSLLVNTPPDMILMDLKMPGITGLETTRQIRAGKFTMPIIAVSASILREDIDAALSVGCNEHLPKPVNKGNLLACLQRNLNLRWEYKHSAETSTSHIQILPEEHRQALLKLVVGGEINKIFEYLEALTLQAEYAETAKYLLKVARSFNFPNLRRQLEINS